MSAALVTVCIPSYRAAPWIAATVASVLCQTERRFDCIVGIEPEEAEATRAVLEAMPGDARLRWRTNERVLGWSGHARALLADVTTPFAVLLPHDDLWHPEYLAEALAALEACPDASVAYPDLALFGGGVAMRALEIPRGDRAQRVTRFLLQGGEAIPWRGVIRRALLAGRPFPDHPHLGFAVEAEWALELVLAGQAIRLPRPLYFKRRFGLDVPSLMRRWRTELGPDGMASALAGHARRLRERLDEAGLAVPPGGLLDQALEVCAAFRHGVFGAGLVPFTGERREALVALFAALPGADGDEGRWLRCGLAMSLARELAAVGEHDEAAQWHARALEADAGHPQAMLAVARDLLAAGRALEAASLGLRAGHAEGASDLLQRAEAALRGHGQP